MTELPYLKRLRKWARVILAILLIIIIVVCAQSCQNKNQSSINRRSSNLVMERNVKYLEEVSAKIVNIFDNPESKTYTVTLEYENKMNNKDFTYDELGNPCEVKVGDYLIVGLYAVYDDVTGEEISRWLR